MIETIDGMNVEGLRLLADRVQKKAPSAVAVFATVADGKAAFVVSVAGDVVKSGVSAGNLAKEMAKCMEGSGGGKDGFAQGGGKSPAGLEKALNKVVDILREKLR